MNNSTRLKHTPGPWRWQNDGHLESLENGPVIMGGAQDANPHGIVVSDSDANLISMAPELLFAAKSAVEIIRDSYGDSDGCPSDCQAVRILEEAITKAEVLI